MQLELRPATSSDIPEIIRLNAIIQQQHAQAYPDTFQYPVKKNHMMKYFKKFLKQENHDIILAFMDEIAVGYMWFEIQLPYKSPLTHPKTCLIVHHIIVEPDFRRMGVASAFFKQLDKISLAENQCEIKLNTWESNQDAHQFFKSQGFKIYKYDMRKLPR